MGPGGGKTTLIEELLRDPDWSGRIAALPEAIALTHTLGVSPRERLFQRVMVHLQMAMEEGLARGLASDDRRLVLCHRGALDPLAYWLDRGWPETEFFRYVGLSRLVLYARYRAIIHLVTAADGAAAHYRRWPEAHRPEQPEDAVRIDCLLARAWGDHPHYHRVDNVGCDWSVKAGTARTILQQYMRES